MLAIVNLNLKHLVGMGCDTTPGVKTRAKAMIALACIVYHFCKGACSEWYASDVAVCDVCVCVSCVWGRGSYSATDQDARQPGWLLTPHI